MARVALGPVVAGVEAAAVRRQVGPLAWCVLESLAGLPDDDGVVGESVRSLAAEVGVSKNAVHRAVGVLVAAGLVVPVQSRVGAGRFGSGGYRLSVPSAVLALASVAASAPAGVSRRRRAGGDGVLSLFAAGV